MRAARSPALSLPRRLGAAAAAALVLVLTLLAASPAAHAWLHAAPQDCAGHAHVPVPDDHDADQGCAVVLMLSGVEVPLEPLMTLPPRLLAGSDLRVTAAAPDLRHPRYLRQPERGPPGSS
jgi:hypothetical protein